MELVSGAMALRPGAQVSVLFGGIAVTALIKNWMPLGQWQIYETIFSIGLDRG